MSYTELMELYDRMTDWRTNFGLLSLRNHVFHEHFTTEENVYQFNLAIFLTKHSHLTETINKMIHQFLAAGLFRRWEQMARRIHKRRLGIQLSAAHVMQMDVEHFSGYIYLYGIGLSLAFVVFVIEIVHHAIKSRWAR